MNNKNLLLTKEFMSYKGQTFDFDMQTDFDYFYDTFRSLTSKQVFLNGAEYRVPSPTPRNHLAVKMSLNGFAVTFIISLKRYYVAGIVADDGTVHSFRNDADLWLTDLGFVTTPMAFDQSYKEMYKYYESLGLHSLESRIVNIEDIQSAFQALSTNHLNFSSKADYILIFLWCMIEGIRFSYISNVVRRIINGEHVDVKYDVFLDLADKWTSLSEAAMHDGTYSEKIAVYSPGHPPDHDEY